MMQTEFCPLCSKNGAKVRVRAYQLNLNEAAFMCSTEECTWPIGYHELLFMDRPLGKYYTKDWPDIADQFLANYLKKQRDSLSELSAYTPPQTPGHSKDTIHDSSTTGPSFLPVVKEDDTLQPSTSESKPFEMSVIDFVGDNSFENKIVSLEPSASSKSEKILVIKKENSGIHITSKNDAFVSNPYAKHLTSLVDKPVVVTAPEKSIVSENVQCKKFRVIGRRKPKSFTYKKQFDIFDDIKKAKSTNEQCKAKVAIKSKIDLGKLKPNEIKEVLFVNNKSKTNDLRNICKVESTVDEGIELEQEVQFIKEEKKLCQADVNSTIGIKKEESVASCLIEILNGDSNDYKVEGNVSLKQSSNEQQVQLIKEEKKLCQADITSTIGIKKKESVASCLIDILNGDSNDCKVKGNVSLKQSSNEQQIQLKKEENKLCQADVTSTIEIEKKETVASSLIQILNGDSNDCKAEGNVELSNKQSSNDHNGYDLDTMMKTSPAEFESGESWSGVDHNLESLLAMLEDDTPTDSLATVNDEPSTSNATSLSKPFIDKEIDIDISKNGKMEVDPVQKELDNHSMTKETDFDLSFEDDTLQCSIEDTEDSFFASLFSPPSKPTN